jgi:hypothetical protein
MTSSMKSVGPDALEKAGPHLVKLAVSFGPAFHNGPMTNGEFIAKLRDEAKRHTRSFLNQMMVHFAEHLEAAAKEGILQLDAPANLNPNTTYYGQGSCSGCPGDDGSAENCCLCSYNGQNIGCENCN